MRRMRPPKWCRGGVNLRKSERRRRTNVVLTRTVLVMSLQQKEVGGKDMPETSFKRDPRRKSAHCRPGVLSHGGQGTWSTNSG